MTFIAILPDLEAISAGKTPSMEPQTERFLNEYGLQMSRGQFQRLPPQTRLEHYKIRVARLETQKFDLQTKVKGLAPKRTSGESATRPMTEGERAFMLEDITRGLALVVTVRAKNRELLEEIRQCAHGTISDAAAEQHRRRLQCIVSKVQTGHLVMALCNCGRLDPQHSLRKHYQAAIDAVLADPQLVQQIDDYIDKYPSVFQTEHGDDVSLDSDNFSPAFDDGGAEPDASVFEGFSPCTEALSALLKNSSFRKAPRSLDFILITLNGRLTQGVPEFTIPDVEVAVKSCQKLALLEYDAKTELVSSLYSGSGRQTQLVSTASQKAGADAETTSEDDSEEPFEASIAMSELGLNRRWHGDLIDHVVKLYNSQKYVDEHDPAIFFQALIELHDCTSTVKARQRWLQRRDELAKEDGQSSHLMVQIIDHCFTQAAASTGQSIDQTPEIKLALADDDEELLPHEITIVDFNVMTVRVTKQGDNFDSAWYTGEIVSSLALLRGCADGVVPMLPTTIPAWLLWASSGFADYNVDKLRVAKQLIDDFWHGTWPCDAPFRHIPPQDDAWWETNSDGMYTPRDNDKARPYWESTKTFMSELEEFPQLPAGTKSVAVAFFSSKHLISGRIVPDFKTKVCRVESYNSEGSTRGDVRSISKYGLRILQGLAELVNIKAGWGQSSYAQLEQDECTRQPLDNAWACGVITSANMEKLVHGLKPVRERGSEVARQKYVLKEREKQMQRLWDAVNKQPLKVQKPQLPTGFPGTIDAWRAGKRMSGMDRMTEAEAMGGDSDDAMEDYEQGEDDDGMDIS